VDTVLYWIIMAIIVGAPAIIVFEKIRLWRIKKQIEAIDRELWVMEQVRLNEESHTRTDLKSFSRTPR
jgi:hypothetical protein